MTVIKVNMANTKSIDNFRRHSPPDCKLPLLIQAATPGEGLLDNQPYLLSCIEQALCDIGGVLLRGFDVPSVDAFQEFARAFGYPLLNYDFGSTPRTAVGGGVYTSTEYPAHQTIPLHNEQAYTREWAMKLWFHCVTAAVEGGETPIADSRAIYRHMPTDIRERFQHGILYVRNYGDFDVPWQTVFNTDSRSEVETYCSRTGIEWEWKADGGLCTRQLCQGIERHPRTGDTVWFNQAHLFHISNQQDEVREILEELLGVEGLPRNVYYANGERIPDSIFDDIRGVIDEQTVIFPWQSGDILMLDNMLVAHGRTPFKGDRKVVVAMAEPHGNLGEFPGEKE